ncbi:unnamed protein product [Vicia faba]|uniref:Transmembrane protein n=1 Tax=Vicia faba TaxID=3906 RepID=A0AAV0ZI31_VICFA|nr:unnamed protein product [Vicia faba]
MMRTRHDQDEQSRAFYELSAIVLNLLRSSPPSRRLPPPQITPAGFASMFLGISLSLMLCGSVTFFIGFVLMPWVIGLFMVLYVAGIVTTLSDFGTFIFRYLPTAPEPRKDVPAW